MSFPSLCRHLPPTSSARSNTYIKVLSMGTHPSNSRTHGHTHANIRSLATFIIQSLRSTLQYVSADPSRKLRCPFAGITCTLNPRLLPYRLRVEETKSSLYHHLRHCSNRRRERRVIHLTTNPQPFLSSLVIYISLILQLAALKAPLSPQRKKPRNSDARFSNISRVQFVPYRLLSY